MCAHRRLRTAFAFTKSDQSLRCALNGKLGTGHSKTTKSYYLFIVINHQNCIFAHRRLRSACASGKSYQSLRCVLYYFFYSKTEGQSLIRVFAVRIIDNYWQKLVLNVFDNTSIIVQFLVCAPILAKYVSQTTYFNGGCERLDWLFNYVNGFDTKR